MRKGRFAGLSDRGLDRIAPPALAELLLFDFAAPSHEDDERAAQERARTLQLSLPVLMGSHLLWAMVLLADLIDSASRAQIVPVAILLSGILLLDGLLWFALRRLALQPYQAMRLTAAQAVVKSGLWLA